MKSVIVAAALFLIAVTFVGVNYFVLDNFFYDLGGELKMLPVDAAELEAMDEASLSEVHERLQRIHKKWEKHETYICLSLPHNMSREFSNGFMPAIAYFEAGDYAGFVAGIRSAEDVLEHMAYDESVRIGNIF